MTQQNIYLLKPEDALMIIYICT